MSVHSILAPSPRKRLPQRHKSLLQWHDLNVVVGIALGSSVKKVSLGRWIVLAKQTQAVYVGFSKDRSSLDLERVKPSFAVKNKVDFNTLHCAPIIERIAEVVVGVFSAQALVNECEANLRPAFHAELPSAIASKRSPCPNSSIEVDSLSKSTPNASAANTPTQVDFPVPRGPSRKELPFGTSRFLEIMLPFIHEKSQVRCLFQAASDVKPTLGACQRTALPTAATLSTVAGQLHRVGCPPFRNPEICFERLSGNEHRIDGAGRNLPQGIAVAHQHPISKQCRDAPA